jgi:Cdc6-like AAA superfamily ATPase
MPLGEIKYLDTILQREAIKRDIKSFLENFENTWKLNTSKKGIYLYGHPGSGKTYFITEILKQLDYDIIVYNAGDVRNKALFQTIDCNNVSNRNVLDLMSRKIKKIAILMDEIDGMNNGDKGGIDALIKLIRQKKTKKQKNENTTLNPIICIGNHESDKKIRELMKACHVFELQSPNYAQISQLLSKELPPYDTFSAEFKTSVLQ